MGHIRLILAKAHQILISHHRKKKVRNFVTFTPSLPEPQVSFEEMVGRSSTEADAKERFWEQFPNAEITEEQKEVFWLNTYEGYTLDELSAKLGKPSSTIHEWIKRVRKECSESHEA